MFWRIGGMLFGGGRLIWAAVAAVAFAPAPASGQYGAGNAAEQSAGKRIVVRPPVFRRGQAGSLLVEPNVSLNGPQYGDALRDPHTPVFEGVRRISSSQPAPPAPGAGGPPADPLFGGIAEEVGEPEIVFGPAEHYHEHEYEYADEPDDCKYCKPLYQMFGFRLFKTRIDDGIGHERVRFAPMELDTTEPLNNVRARFTTNHGLVTPDRAEYFWARPGVGPPLPERRVDYQEFRLLLEAGGGRFSMLTELPIRSLDPVVNDNTTGLSNISLGPKAVLIDGKRWQFSHIFRTYLKTAAVGKGLGVDQISLEPAAMLRYEWTKETYLHAELKYRFPVGGDADFAGEVLRYGVGISTIAYETDTFAALPTLEFVGWNVMDGQKSLPDGRIVGVDGESFGAVYSGMVFVLGPAGDLGLFELGVQGGRSFSNNGFFENHFKIDLRFSY